MNSEKLTIDEWQPTCKPMQGGHEREDSLTDKISIYDNGHSNYQKLITVDS